MSECPYSTWTIEFLQVNESGSNFEIRPDSLTIKEERGQYDFARAKFGREVGIEMMPHTRYEDGALREPTGVLVKRGDTVVKRLYFKPDFAQYNKHVTHLEFHDPQEVLDDQVVDLQRKTAVLKDVYTDLFYLAEHHDRVFEGIKFSIPEDLSGELGRTELETEKRATLGRVKSDEQDATKGAVLSGYNIDFEQITPGKAMWKLNKEYGLQTWTSADGYLWVGTPEADARYHIASQGDDRVWHYDTASLRHAREPIKKVIIKGGWQDASGIGTIEDAISMFSPTDSAADVQAMAWGIRNHVPQGQTIIRETQKTKKNAVEPLAEMYLREEMKKQNSGTVKINPRKSGNFTPLDELKIGDFLHVVPDDHYYPRNVHPDTGNLEEFRQLYREGYYEDFCDLPTVNEAYIVTGIQHKVEGGHWTIQVDIGMWPWEAEIYTQFRYFDPQTEEYYDTDSVFNDNWFEAH